MCIIAAKPAGVAMPDTETITRMWTRNPDGAGLMWTEGNSVHIEKGFMKLKKFLAFVDDLASRTDLTSTPVVMHFRITTHGGTCPENTHPFPVSESMGLLKKLKCTTSLGAAHNGIIDIRTRKGVSDTMEFIATRLAILHKILPKFYENKDALRLVANEIDSKMALLTKDGRIITIGDFVEDGGILYSNTSYKGYYGAFSSSKFYSYPSYTDGGYELYTNGYNAQHDVNEDADYGDDLTERYLVPLELTEGYVLFTEDEETLPTHEAWDYFLGQDGRVWCYDMDSGYCYLSYATEARDEFGSPMQWDPELAEPMLCFPTDYTSM